MTTVAWVMAALFVLIAVAGLAYTFGHYVGSYDERARAAAMRRHPSSGRH
jgi:hypothetical protein